MLLISEHTIPLPSLFLSQRLFHNVQITLRSLGCWVEADAKWQCYFRSMWCLFLACDVFDKKSCNFFGSRYLGGGRTEVGDSWPGANQFHDVQVAMFPEIEKCSLCATVFQLLTFEKIRSQGPYESTFVFLIEVGTSEVQKWLLVCQDVVEGQRCYSHFSRSSCLFQFQVEF